MKHFYSALTLYRSNVSYEWRWYFFQIGMFLTPTIWLLFHYTYRENNWLIISIPATFSWAFAWAYYEYKNRDKIAFLKDRIVINDETIELSQNDYFEISNSVFFNWSIVGRSYFIRVYGIYLISHENNCKFRLYSNVFQRQTEKMLDRINSIYNFKIINKIKKSKIKRYTNRNIEYLENDEE